MKERKAEIDALNSNVAITFFTQACNLHIVECEVLKFLFRPWCEH